MSLEGLDGCIQCQQKSEITATNIQELANVFCKGPGSKHFRLCHHEVCAATTHLCPLYHHGIKLTTEKTHMSDYGYAPTKLHIYQELSLIENMGHEILLISFNHLKM